MPVTTWNLQRGRLLFQSFCIGCHGQGGAGVSPAAQFLRPPPANFTDPDAAASDPAASPGDWYYRILRGVPGTAMEDFGTRLHVADIWRVVLFLKTIPNGGLAVNQLPTPDLYIQWAPSPGLLAYLKTHPMEQNYEFVAGQAQSGGDPWFLEARRVLPGLSVNDRIMVPGYGEVSLKAARDGIRRIYDQMLTEGWHDYLARGERPIPPPGQKEIPPDLGRELR